MPTPHQIAKLQLPPDLHADYSVVVSEGEDPQVLTGLSQINLFVGSNNSGKSRLLRCLLAKEKHMLLPAIFADAAQKTSAFVKIAMPQIAKGDCRIEPFSTMAEQLPDFALLLEGDSKVHLLNNFIQQSENAKPTDFQISFRGHPPDSMVVTKHLQHLGRDARKLLGAIPPQVLHLASYRRVYIPTLRGLRPSGSGDCYQDRTKKDYFKGKIEFEIFTGLTFYNDLREMLLGDHQARKIARAFEDFLAIELFEGVQVTLIPNVKSDVVHIRIGNEREQPVHNLGDGIQQLIILTFPLFQNRDQPSLIFIEEPELFLHPGMQRSLIKAMTTFDNYQYFITTHSNHLLDLTLEFDNISIYMVRKSLKDEKAEESAANFTIEPASTHDTRLLDSLGARASSVFLSNCTVWVEGITDRRYLAKGLHLYLDHLTAEAQSENSSLPFRPRQDLHYSFVEYSGGNITHWSFLDTTDDPVEVTRLCGRLMLIVDKDGDKKIGRHEALEKELGDRFVPLPCNEIENLLTPEILKAVVREYEGDDAEIDGFTQEEYRGAYLGTFLESKITNKKRKGPYAEDSGTVTDKKGFCAKAISHQKSWFDLSADAQQLVERIYRFIKTHNR
ncbi:MAG TPA: AAA family ATPase [Prosthecobacter sp.]|nr:AAA family ATPase [Prosthecobacter sp.]